LRTKNASTSYQPVEAFARIAKRSQIELQSANNNANAYILRKTIHQIQNFAQSYNFFLKKNTKK
jgi:hypothetical protein